MPIMDVRAENLTKHRGYQIKPDKQYPSLLVVMTDGKGGKIPNVLTGLFTSRTVAMNSIDSYLDKSKVNAEAIS